MKRKHEKYQHLVKELKNAVERIDDIDNDPYWGSLNILLRTWIVQSIGEWELKNTPTASLQRGMIPSMSVLDIIVNNLMLDL